MKFIALAAAAVAVLGAFLVIAADASHNTLWRPMTTLVGALSITLASVALVARRFRLRLENVGREINAVRIEHEAAKVSLAARETTVDRLLQFSQTIQGAGKAEQVYTTLGHFLRVELQLAGVAIFTHDPECVPMTEAVHTWPETLIKDDRCIGEIDPAMVPCLRQNLPRVFKPDASPVRCGFDHCLTLDTDHPALCVPFNIGRKISVLVHMILPVGGEWNEDQRQLAQTYVNTATAALVSLHLLAEAEKLSLTDALTGLYNRRSLDSLLQREVAMADRYNHPLSLVMIDMDHFKEINDAHGHAAGDHMLRAFSDCVRITLRKTDLAFRYGGDEFAIALPQTPILQAQQVVNKLRQAFAAVDFTNAIAHLDHPPTLSIGVAERCRAGGILTLASLMTAADQALYEAKADNRNCVKLYQPPRAA